MFDLTLRTNQLKQFFSYEKKNEMGDTHIEIVPYRFTQHDDKGEIRSFQEALQPAAFCPVPDDHIEENNTFPYVVFNPEGHERSKGAILLLHGLNERSWEKYLTWAEYLAVNTEKPVVLFPIAFHMNRTPEGWINPHLTLPWAKRRKAEDSKADNATFANVALSTRIDVNPLRFYASGRESVHNVKQLATEMKQGLHPLFAEDVKIDIFAYSIGALLAQVLFLARDSKLFDNSRLFMFCGGSIFSQMNGSARDIMDQDAFERLHNYLYNDFATGAPLPESFPNDAIQEAFRAMLRPDILTHFREMYFEHASDRIRAISLRNDVVSPTLGIKRALGKASEKILKELDFPFPYSHQVPFPMKTRIDPIAIEEAFKSVFRPAADFLSKQS